MVIENRSSPPNLSAAAHPNSFSNNCVMYWKFTDVSEEFVLHV